MYRIIGADGKEYGPATAEQVRQWIVEGRANGDTRALLEGTSDWKRLGDFREFSLLFAVAGGRSIPAPAIYPPPARKTNGLAIASLIMGVIAFSCFCCCYGFPFNLLGLIFALVAIGQINGNPNLYEGKSLAIAGMVLCALSLALALLFVIFSGAMSILQQGGHRVYRL